MFRNNWFCEASDSWPGQALELQIDEILYEGKSKFQNILVLKSRSYGNILVLDGVIQVTERDECAYQEMICHIPLMAHPNPKRVLVVGGGDGGCIREILKHSCVDSVDLVEIDDAVLQLSKKYFPKLSKDLDNEKVTIHIMDGFEFLENSENESRYDVIISDTSDPEGPAAQLFEQRYFELLYKALAPNGIVSLQASENVWLRINILEELQSICKKVFPVAKYCTTCVPTYTSGQLGIMVCAKNPATDVMHPIREFNLSNQLEYYTAALHSASFVLPTFARKFIDNA